MTDFPPPATPPPPGWYPDPTPGGHGFRWWDGNDWTDRWSAQPDSNRHPLTPVREWFRATIQLAGSRAGHLFALVVVLLLPLGLANSVANFYAFRGLVIVTDEEASTFELRNDDGDLGVYALSMLSYLAVLAAGIVLVVAAVRHLRAAVDERPEAWSTSLQDALRRSPRAVLNVVALLIMLIGMYVIMAVGVVLVPLLVLIALPLWIVGSIWLLVRFSLLTPTAALAPAGVRTLATSYSLTSGRTGAIIARMAVLSLTSLTVWLMARIVAAPFLAIAGAEGGNLEPGATEIRFADFIGDNPATFAVGQLFSSLGNGLSLVLWASGLCLLYRELAGPAADDGAEAADDGVTGPTTPGPGPGDV